MLASPSGNPAYVQQEAVPDLGRRLLGDKCMHAVHGSTSQLDATFITGLIITLSRRERRNTKLVTPHLIWRLSRNECACHLMQHLTDLTLFHHSGDHICMADGGVKKQI